jgi:hypothetical protein
MKQLVRRCYDSKPAENFAALADLPGQWIGKVHQ